MDKKVTLITGGNGGIGRSVVRKFLENGDLVVVFDINKINNPDIVNNENYDFINVDVTNYNEIQKGIEIINNKYGYIDNIISMAGARTETEINSIEFVTKEDIDKSIDLNLKSHIYLIKNSLKLLKNSKSREKVIVFVSSINAITNYGLPAYSAGKAGIYGFMNSIVNEMSKLKIRVNTLSLGTVPHNYENTEGCEYFENMLKDIPYREFVKPKDVAETLYSLVYMIRGIVGQNIVLDMGQSI